MNTAYLLLGSNMNHRELMLTKAKQMISGRIGRISGFSSIYETTGCLDSITFYRFSNSKVESCNLFFQRKVACKNENVIQLRWRKREVD